MAGAFVLTAQGIGARLQALLRGAQPARTHDSPAPGAFGQPATGVGPRVRRSRAGIARLP